MQCFEVLDNDITSAQERVIAARTSKLMRESIDLISSPKLAIREGGTEKPRKVSKAIFQRTVQYRFAPHPAISGDNDQFLGHF